MGVRRQAREAALQVLYLADITSLPREEAATIIWNGLDLPPRARSFANELAMGTLTERALLDKIIMKYAENWEIHRMAAVDRNILRLAAYELLHKTDTPVSVVIDEAVEIAKTYSTQDSGKFVNGILDKVKLDRPPEPPREPAPNGQGELF